jgi:CRISPR/Cas system-associated exonuclease Cas4 (RecB family)
MSQYYNPKRTRNVFDPKQTEPFKISRSKIELFLSCPRCYYLDARLGVGRPPGFPFSLNSAVDHLLKKEFDIHRANKTAHPLMEHYKIRAIPFSHPEIDKWRENFVGIQFLHKPTNFLVTGAVDDVWVNDKKELIVVDYKSTSKDEEVTLDAEWQKSYKNQMEIYQWLLKQNGFEVSDTGYFVYANGKKDRKAFDAKLEFDVKLIPYKGSTDWIPDILAEMRKCLLSDIIPEKDDDCDYCRYIEAINENSKQPKAVKTKKEEDFEPKNTLF